MTPSRILPDLQCSIICDDVRQESNGSFILLGVVNVIRVPQVPITVLKLCVFNRWTAGFGQFMETVRLIGPDQTTVLGKSEKRFSLQDVVHSSTTVTVWSPAKFDAAGPHYVEILVDDVMKLRFPIPVIVVSPEQRPETGPKKEP